MPTPFADVVRDHRGWLLAAVGQAALDTGLWHALAEPRTADELAAVLALDRHGTRCTLDALAIAGFATKRTDRYAQGPRPNTVALPNEGWGRLAEFLRSGVPLLHGPVPGDPGLADARRRYLQHLDLLAEDVAAEVARLLPTPVVRFVDAGCGFGRFCWATKSRHVEAAIAGVDCAEVIQFARQQHERAGIEWIAADLCALQRLPHRPTHALLANVLHLYTPAAARRLVDMAATSLDPGGWLAVVDVRTEADGAAPDLPVLFALDLALHCGGWLIPLTELAAWMQEVGLAVVANRALDCAPETGLVVARKPVMAP
jgi:SAM-dependent methyltransferase